MVDTSLELVCGNCGGKFWYSGEKNYPDSVECVECGKSVEIPEDA